MHKYVCGYASLRILHQCAEDNVQMTLKKNVLIPPNYHTNDPKDRIIKTELMQMIQEDENKTVNGSDYQSRMRREEEMPGSDKVTRELGREKGRAQEGCQCLGRGSRPIYGLFWGGGGACVCVMGDREEKEMKRDAQRVR